VLSRGLGVTKALTPADGMPADYPRNGLLWSIERGAWLAASAGVRVAWPFTALGGEELVSDARVGRGSLRLVTRDGAGARSSVSV
jgi:hypothetical protein